MKNLTFLFILIIFLFSSSCKKVEDKSSQEFSVLKNGEQWIPTFSLVSLYTIEQKFRIQCKKQILNTAEEEFFNIEFFLKDISNTMSVGQFNSTWYKVIGGDGITDKYNIVNDPANFIQINSLDTTNKYISGTFYIKLLRDKFYQHPEDTLFFSQGYFSHDYLFAVSLN